MYAMTQHNLNTTFVDQYGRSKRKLRISVTDRCNFKCVYCMPEHPEWIKKHDLLSFEELYQFCEFMVQHGIEHIRITGGEPLMRKGVVHFIYELKKLKIFGLKRISMTTNAHYLNQYAEALKQAGLDDLNISLDSLDEKQFKQLTQKELRPVLDGIVSAQNAGFKIKINAVLIKGLNENQILPLAHWSIENNLSVRFIEFMPLDGDAQWSKDDVVTEQEILLQLKQDFKVTIQHGQSSEPARQYFINGYPIGIISTITNSFCGTCDRVRLTAQGDFYNCLFSPQGISLKAQIKALNIDDSEHSKILLNTQLEQILSKYIWHKKQGFDAIQHEAMMTNQQKHSNQMHSNQMHQLIENKKYAVSRKISMYMIGG